MRLIYIYIIILALSSISTNALAQFEKPELINNATFKGFVDGKKIELFTLKNKNGIVTQITNYGGRVVNLWVPDKDGNFEDVVLGYESLDGYLSSNEIYYGALIGRYGNRIAKGKFSLSDKVYTLATNNNENHLHGGTKGFNDVVWEAEQLDNQSLKLVYLSKIWRRAIPVIFLLKLFIH